MRHLLVPLLIMSLVVMLPLPAWALAMQQPHIEAVCITYLGNRSHRWLNSVESCRLLRLLRHVEPYSGSLPTAIPWEQRITLGSEQGDMSFVLNLELGIISWPPFEHIGALPQAAIEYLKALENGQQVIVDGMAVPFLSVPAAITATSAQAVTVEQAQSGGTLITLRSPRQNAGIRVVAVSRVEDERVYNIYVHYCTTQPQATAARLFLPPEYGFKYLIMEAP